MYIYIRIYVVVSKLGTPESRGASSFSTMKSNCNLGMQHFFQTNTCYILPSCYIHFTIHSFQISRKQEQS